ncbi:MAG: DUF4197 domain-containing protein [Bacteroidia bacterium]
MQNLKFSSIAITMVLFFSCGNTIKIVSTNGDAKKGNIGEITQEEAANGLKELLKKGTGIGVDFLSKKDGFFKNLTYKILFPPEAQKMEKTLRKYGFGKQCDQVIENINRGAEMAVAEAKPVFVNAIVAMTIKDAIGIVTGGNGAGTAYLKRTTMDELRIKFKPIIQKSLDKTEATKYWTSVMTSYNKIPMVEKINPDLNAHVTNKALEALFSQIEIEENKIRKDPINRTTELLKKVFDYADLLKKK